MRDGNDLGKALLALCWAPVAIIAYVCAFGAGMVRIALRDGWDEFK